MNKQQVLEMISKIDVSSFRPQLDLAIVPSTDDKVRLSAMLKVDSTVTARKGLWLVNVGDGVAETIDPVNATESSVNAAARSACLKVLTHEFDEHYKFDGRAVHNPHVSA